MRRNPFIAVLCLCFLCCVFFSSAPGGQNSINVVIDHQALLADPDPSEEPLYIQASAPPVALGASNYLRTSGPKQIRKCSGPVCEPAPVCAPTPPCILPRRLCGQWEFGVQVFFARVKGAAKWPIYGQAVIHPSMDFNDPLGLPAHATLLEYSGAYQFRPNWSLFYSIMPIELEAHYTLDYFPGIVFKSKWQSVYQRVGLAYTAINTCNATVRVWGSWLFNENRLLMNSGSHCPQNRQVTLDRTRNMVMAGLDFQKCIRTMCNGSTLSCDNRVGIGFLDGTFGLDVQAGLRYSVPMNCGRWGYARGGYRLISFRENRSDLQLDTNLEGWFVEMGMIF